MLKPWKLINLESGLDKYLMGLATNPRGDSVVLVQNPDVRVTLFSRGKDCGGGWWVFLLLNHSWCECGVRWGGARCLVETRAQAMAEGNKAKQRVLDQGMAAWCEDDIPWHLREPTAADTLVREALTNAERNLREERRRMVSGCYGMGKRR